MSIIVAIPIIGAISLAFAMLVETSSWWVRAYAPSSSIGLYVSRSNIMLYGMRSFLLLFNASIAFFIESGATPYTIAFSISLAFGLAALTHVLLLGGGDATHIVMSLTRRILLLPSSEMRPRVPHRLASSTLYRLTTFATIIFGFGMGVPLLVAVLVPDYRLSISYLGQIINIAGMVLVLLYIDQHLFKALDAGDIMEKILLYSHGRSTAFAVVSLIFLFSGLAVY